EQRRRRDRARLGPDVAAERERVGHDAIEAARLVAHDLPPPARLLGRRALEQVERAEDRAERVLDLVGHLRADGAELGGPPRPARRFSSRSRSADIEAATWSASTRSARRTCGWPSSAASAKASRIVPSRRSSARSLRTRTAFEPAAGARLRVREISTVRISPP